MGTVQYLPDFPSEISEVAAVGDIPAVGVVDNKVAAAVDNLAAGEVDSTVEDPEP
jgi:hypothetical protein